ncbi:MAG: arylsulfatase [Bacteroidetes bacterium]|nr:arylsulfatase [Bacteroidota bacterium]
MFRLIKIAFLIVLTFTSFIGCKQNTAKQQPNIVYILCDDLGYGDIHANAPATGKIPTPNVDKLISEGMRFTNAHSGSSVCTPTRYGLLTGRYSWRSRLQEGVVQATEGPLIEAERITVAGFLKTQGYQTGIVGKWHLNYSYQNPHTKEKIIPPNLNKSSGVPLGTIIPDGPITRGFDYFYGFHHIGSMKTVVENDKVIKEIEMEELLPLLGKQAVNFINDKAEDAKNGKPFFLYVPLSSPHGPIVPTEEWIGKSGLNLFGDFVMQTDWTVGQIINALEQQGISDNTLLIFTSDNGTSPIANFKELNDKGHFPTANLKGHKADIWDGGHRVPFVVRWANGNVPAGSVSDQLICLTDFMPTCAELLGTKLPKNTAADGVSFFPALFHNKISDERKAVVHHSVNGKFAIRKGKWKLIFCKGSGGWSNPTDDKAAKLELPKYQLYNMETDISEKNNVYTDYPEIVEELSNLLEELIANGRSTPGEKIKNDVSIDIWKISE